MVLFVFVVLVNFFVVLGGLFDFCSSWWVLVVFDGSSGFDELEAKFLDGESFEGQNFMWSKLFEVSTFFGNQMLEANNFLGHILVGSKLFWY